MRRPQVPAGLGKKMQSLLFKYVLFSRWGQISIIWPMRVTHADGGRMPRAADGERMAEEGEIGCASF